MPNKVLDKVERYTSERFTVELISRLNNSIKLMLPSLMSSPVNPSKVGASHMPHSHADHDDLAFEIDTKLASSLISRYFNSRVGAVADVLKQPPFSAQQQAIATELLHTVHSAIDSSKGSTVFDTVIGLLTQYIDQYTDVQYTDVMPQNASPFATRSSNGQRINNGQSFNATELKWTRSDGKSDGRNATVVTYAFDDSFSVNGISTDEAESLFIEALETWASYAPLDFVEVSDPGSGSGVDIFVESGNIDGQGGTLAFAYFPTVGDIKFDSSETWTTDTFLETAVHELGHSLGLDHENDTDAIMNSVIGNRFDNGEAFLYNDDVSGIQSLYGSGQGSVQTLGAASPTAPPPPPSSPPSLSNLVTNGSFEDVPLSVGEYGLYSQINGWSTISGRGFQIDRRPDSAGSAADGTAWAELDTLGENSTIGQNVDTVTGQRYNVSVDFSNGGRPEATTSVEVFWEGQQVDTLSGGGKGEWRRFNYTLTGSDRSVSTLAFRAVGDSDNVGGFVDNIVVTAASESLMDTGHHHHHHHHHHHAGSSHGHHDHSAHDFDHDPVTGDRNGILVDSSLILPHSTDPILV